MFPVMDGLDAHALVGRLCLELSQATQEKARLVQELAACRALHSAAGPRRHAAASDTIGLSSSSKAYDTQRVPANCDSGGGQQRASPGVAPGEQELAACCRELVAATAALAVQIGDVADWQLQQRLQASHKQVVQHVSSLVRLMALPAVPQHDAASPTSLELVATPCQQPCHRQRIIQQAGHHQEHAVSAAANTAPAAASHEAAVPLHLSVGGQLQASTAWFHHQQQQQGQHQHQQQGQQHQHQQGQGQQQQQDAAAGAAAAAAVPAAVAAPDKPVGPLAHCGNSVQEPPEAAQAEGVGGAAGALAGVAPDHNAQLQQQQARLLSDDMDAAAAASSAPVAAGAAPVELADSSSWHPQAGLRGCHTADPLAAEAAACPSSAPSASEHPSGARSAAEHPSGARSAAEHPPSARSAGEHPSGGPSAGAGAGEARKRPPAAEPAPPSSRPAAMALEAGSVQLATAAAAQPLSSQPCTAAAAAAAATTARPPSCQPHEAAGPSTAAGAATAASPVARGAPGGQAGAQRRRPIVWQEREAPAVPLVASAAPPVVGPEPPAKRPRLQPVGSGVPPLVASVAPPAKRPRLQPAGSGLPPSIPPQSIPPGRAQQRPSTLAAVEAAAAAAVRQGPQQQRLLLPPVPTVRRLHPSGGAGPVGSRGGAGPVGLAGGWAPQLVPAGSMGLLGTPLPLMPLGLGLRLGLLPSLGFGAPHPWAGRL